MLKLMFSYLPNDLQPRQGFSLVELMFAIAIVGVLAAFAFASYSRSQILARDLKRKNDLRSVAASLELFYQSNRRYPCSNGTTSQWLADTVACGGQDITLVPKYIDKLPLDPVGVNPYTYFSANFGTCLAQQSFVIRAILENANDVDALSKKPATTPLVCGSTPTTLMGGGNNWSANTYVVSSK